MNNNPPDNQAIQALSNEPATATTESVVESAE